MAKKNIRIDFYQLVLNRENEVKTIKEGFDQVINTTISNNCKDSDFLREIYKLEKKNSEYYGCLRKFRNDDLPRVSTLGGDEIDLELEDGQGLVEQNGFIYFPKHSVLAYHYNQHANHISRFTDVLSKLFNANIEAIPLIASDTFKRLMKTGTTLVTLEARIPAPRSQSLLPDADDFTQDALRLIGKSDADYLTINLGVDRRHNGGLKRLTNTLKNSIKDINKLEPKKLTAMIDEGGIVSPIDLIADRIKKTRQIETHGRYIDRAILYETIHNAFNDVSEEIDNYFKLDE